jgi:hypothetical protein
MREGRGRDEGGRGRDEGGGGIRGRGRGRGGEGESWIGGRVGRRDGTIINFFS